MPNLNAKIEKRKAGKCCVNKGMGIRKMFANFFWRYKIFFKSKELVNGFRKIYKGKQKK